MLLYYVFWLWLVYFLTKLCKFVIFQVKLYWLVKGLPGPEIQVPLFGHIGLFMSTLRGETNFENYSTEIKNTLFRKYENEHGIVRLWMGPLIPVVFVTDIKLARRLLATNFNKSSHYQIFGHLFGTDNLITCKESEYKKYRIYFNPHFKANALDSYMSKTMINLHKLDQCIDDIIKENDGKLSNASKLVSSFVFETLAESLFSIKFNCLTKKSVPYYIKKIYDFSYLINRYAIWTQVSRWPIVTLLMIGCTPFFILRINQVKFSYHCFVGFTKMVLEAHGRLKNTQIAPQEMSLLDSLVFTNIVQKKTYFQKFRGYFNVMCHGAIFIVAGYTTTAGAITDILYYLAKHPDVQTKLADEIDNFKKLLTTNGEGMTFLSLKRLNYLNAVIKESLRLNSPLNFIGRMTSTPMVINDRISIPANVDVLVSLQQILKSDKYFRDPERFYPERFLEQTDFPICSNREDLEGSEANWCTERAFIPFSMGVRECPGREYSLMQIKLLLFSVLSNYSFELHGKIQGSVPQYIVILGLRKFGLKFYKRS